MALNAPSEVPHVRAEYCVVAPGDDISGGATWAHCRNNFNDCRTYAEWVRHAEEDKRYAEAEAVAVREAGFRAEIEAHKAYETAEARRVAASKALDAAEKALVAAEKATDEAYAAYRASQQRVSR